MEQIMGSAVGKRAVFFIFSANFHWKMMIDQLVKGKGEFRIDSTDLFVLL